MYYYTEVHNQQLSLDSLGHRADRYADFDSYLTPMAVLSVSIWPIRHDETASKAKSETVETEICNKLD